MQKRTISIVLTLLLTASLLLVLVPGALSQGMQQPGNRSGKAMNVDEIYAAVKVTGATNSSATYDIMNIAVKGKDGKVATMSPAKPLAGTYYFANDTAIIPMGNKTGVGRHKPVAGDYSNATIKVAGASAVIAMKNVTTVKQGKGNFETQFTGISVYLPDGSVKSYTLTTPVRIVGSRDKKTVTVIANPAMRADLQSAMAGNATFPANAAPVPLKTIDAAR